MSRLPRTRATVVSLATIVLMTPVLLGTADAGAASATTTKVVPLIDHGGKIVPASTTYAIWWGPSTGFPGDARGAVESILQTLNGSSYLNIATQYLRGASATTSFEGSLYDASAPPNRSMSTTALTTEVASVLKDNGLSSDPNAIYLVFTSNFATGGACAWHGSGTITSATVQVAYMPNATGIKGCDAGYPFGSYSEGTRSIIDSMVHEFMESVSDAEPKTAWYDKNGAEIGDKCNATVGPVVLGKVTWYVQGEWSNADAACVYGVPPTH